MADKRQHIRQNAEASRVSSTSDVRMCSEQRQRIYAHSPAFSKTHTPNLERVDEESSTMVDSSTDHAYRGGQMFYNHHHSKQPHFAHNGPFKKPAHQGYIPYPITPPYYENRYPCSNPMCREMRYCYEHSVNREIYNSSVPLPPGSFTHDCHVNWAQQVSQTSPLFMHSNLAKRADNDLPRPKPEWPPGYRPANHTTAPSTPAQYLATLSGKDNNSLPPSTATSLRSSNLEPFMHPSSFPSPRQSARMGRKRAISSSPLSIDSIDINSLIRTSPDSLIAYINAPRLSSAGSYGHLSANGISPSPKPSRSSSMRSPMFGCWQSTSISFRGKSQFNDLKDSEEIQRAQATKHEITKKEIKMEPREEKMIIDGNNNDESKLSSVNSPSVSDKRESDGEKEENNEVIEKDENNKEFLCLWKDCNVLFQTRDKLVEHVNTDHIKKDRRDFTCHWVDCQRGQKPFKAQYMLVVHMRRHTGEKPNKCPYEGCDKAYSRLENLKTHERSHTGERPYVCEYENCNKAFTNASDRAKHQNRTHSSVKPYVCTVAGCTKRYTDPSSLRKHKKTCHPEHFAGAKKPKVDEMRSKPSDGNKSSPSAEKSSVNDSQGKVNHPTGHVKPNGEQTKEPGQGNGTSTHHQVDFSPQSCSGELTSSSSCVDSPQSANIVCDESEEMTLVSNGKADNYLKKSSSPRSPQPTAQYPFPEMSGFSQGGGDVLVENPVAPNHLTLPAINKQNEVGKWIADVTQRMNHVGRFSNELKENVPMDYGSRRSSESGVSSYISSRRSSEVSTHLNRPPHGAVPPLVEGMSEDMYPPNKQATDVYQMQKLSQINQWGNNHRRHELYDDKVRPSPIPDTFHAEQRRSSSGYGSHHNLAIIRSPVFHKVPIQNFPEPPVPANRRMSDSIVCEADSSNRYLPLHNSNVVPRRSSEPATNHRSEVPNAFQPSLYQQMGPMDNVRNLQTLNYMYRRQTDVPSLANWQGSQVRSHPLDRGQKLTHYPYSMDPSNQDYMYPPHPPSYRHETKSSQPYPQKGLWQYEQHINQKLLQAKHQANSLTHNQGHADSTGQEVPSMNGQEIPGEGSYELMLNGMGNLNTSEVINDVILPNGPSNMVVNDMNTLLNSLIEEDRYLEKKYEHDSMGGALSRLF